MEMNENVMDLPNHIGEVAKVGDFEGVIAYDRVRKQLVVRNHFGHVSLGYYNSVDGFAPNPSASKAVVK